MRKIRKPVSILLLLVMILSMFTIIAASVQAAEVCTDTLTVDDTGATRTNYVSWTAQNGEDHPNISSDAVYAGDSAKGNDGIQMRSKSQSGIVSTGSGGKVRKVTVAWIDTYQNDDRELAVYGSNSAYSSAADLYTDGARGNLLDTFCYNDAAYSEEESVYYNVLETADDYRYIGLRSRSGALYLASVTIDWEIPQAGHVWNWADDYSAATCTFTDGSGSHTETASVTSEVTKEPTYIEEGVLTHTAVVTYDGVNYRDVQTEAIPRLEFVGSVPYIDENGIQQDSPAGTMLLTGAETELTSGWYAAASNTTVDDIKVSGNVKIILCDGVTVKAASMSTFRVSGSNDKLTFYGQEDNSGAIGDVNSYCTVEGKGELTVNGGTFCKCGLRAGSSMTINGGKINDASGNVTLYCPNGTLTVNGGDVYCSAGNECVDCNSFVYNGGVFNGRSSFTGVYCRGESATFSWKYENDSVYFSQLGCWKLIDIMSNTSHFEGFSVTLLKDFVDKNGNKYPAGNYNSWDLRYTTLYPDVDKWQILQQKINDSQSGDVITLKSDYKASSDNTALVVPQGKEVLTIDLNGHTIDRGLSSKDAFADGNVITNHATELHIIDSSRSKNGRITGGNNTGDGGGIISDVNTLELNGVTVSGNKSAGNGGGIRSNSVVVLNDSTVKENRAGGSGGGIYCSRNHHNNKINVSGSVNVTGNTKSDGTADNVYFSGSQNIIQVTGQLASGSRIGVGTSAQTQTITSGLNGKGTAANFTSDKKGYLVTLTSGGDAKLAKAYVIHFDPNGGSGEMDDIVTLDTTVTMPECTFTAPEGKRFKAWSDGYGNNSIQEDEEIGISSGIYEYTISAVWADIHTITVDQPEHGSIRANKREAIEGERVRLTATPEEGYRLHHFTVTYGNGQTVNVNNNSYFYMPDADVTVSVTWAQEHTITVSCGSHGTASADKDIAVEGETVTVMFQPDKDYELDAIKVTNSEDSEIDVGDDHSFGMPDSDVIVTVSFKHAASEHTADKMTRHEAITPTYNSENGSYINGCVEYYSCPVCSGCFVEENDSFVKKTVSELIVPYFRFRSVTSEGHQQCVILDYNGTDADVVIPETVPAGYPDSSRIGNTVTGLDHNAFKDKTFVTNVTIGDGLNGICESAFEGCTGLRTVTIGSGLNRIGKDAFKGCSALESFTTTSTNSIQYQYSSGYGDESAGQFSFDPDTDVVFHAPHNSSLLYAAIDYGTAFAATDRHDEPTWNWSYDYSSATATFDCGGTCQLNGNEHSAAISRDGTVYTATVTVDGKDYTDTVDVAESAAAMIAPDHYYTDFRSAIIAAHDTYNDAVIELLKDTSFTWDPELCKNYPSFTVKRNSHTLDYTSHPCYPVSKTDDSSDVVTYTANAEHTELTLRSVLNESDGEYSIIMFFLCGICGERIDETIYEAEKHAAKAATCTETGNIEYYIISEELGSTVITYYYVLADTPEYENEVTCIVDDEIAAVTVPIDPNAHQLTNDPEWSWTGSDSEGYTAATATFTCSRCSATETVIAAVTSKTNDGSTTYTATVEFEGKTYTASKQVFDDGIGVHLAGHSISLEGDIAVNFYMEIAPEVVSHEGVYMQFTVPNTSKEYHNQKVYLKNLEPVSIGDKTYYVFKCKVAAKDMNSEISAQLIDGDKTSTVYKYSVKEYADYLIEHQDDNQTFKEAVPLVEAMLKYGTYANNYFSDANALEELAVDIPEKAYTETALPEGVTFDGATLSLKSQTTLSLYFVSEQEITLSMNGKTEGKDYELAHNGNEYVIRIRNISAAELNDDFTVTVISNGQSGTVTYSPMTYCYKAQTSSNAKLANVVKALYLYWVEADQYFNQNQGGI